MDKPKKRLMRYTDAEISLIKSTFKDDDVLKEVRKQFWQKEANLNVGEDGIALLRKTLLPELDANAPLHQVIDLWLTLSLKDKVPHDALNIIKARELLVKYFEQEFGILVGAKKTRKIKLADLTEVIDDPDQMIVNLVARNEIITHIEQQIGQLSILANQDTQKLIDDMLKNSAK